jgi:hypothetical protein
MESGTLYGTPARWPMTRNDDKADPPKPAPPPAEVPRAPFAPPVQNPAVLALLNGLNPAVTPVPTLTSTTDGELSAQFEAGPRAAPLPGETPPPEASVVVNPEGPKKKKKDPPDPSTLQSTFRNVPRKSSPVPFVIAGLVIVAGVGVALFLRNGDVQTTTTPAGAPSVASPEARATPLAPVKATAAPVASVAPQASAASDVPAPTSSAKGSPSSTAAKPASVKSGDIDPGSTPF